MPDLSIVDSHVHLWDPARFSMPWLASLPLLNRAYGIPEYEESAEGLPVSALVYVEVAVDPAEALREAQELVRLAQNEPRLQAIVAAAPLEQGKAAYAHLETLAAMGSLIKGVRRNLQDEGMDFCLQPAFVQGVQMLADFGFSFDICIRHQQLPGVIELVRQCPGVEFVLDHVGKPDIKHNQLDPWQSQIQTLATLPDVQCKISGMVTEADISRWETSQLAPFAHVVLEAFGEDRVMFGGDWPVLLQASPYRRWYESAHELTRQLSYDAQRKFWSENARRFYRLEMQA